MNTTNTPFLTPHLPNFCPPYSIILGTLSHTHLCKILDELHWLFTYLRGRNSPLLLSVCVHDTEITYLIYITTHQNEEKFSPASRIASLYLSI